MRGDMYTVHQKHTLLYTLYKHLKFLTIRFRFDGQKMYQLAVNVTMPDVYREAETELNGISVRR